MQKLIRGSGLGHAFLAALWSFPFCRCHFICWVPRFKIALQAYVRFLYCERSHFQICTARLKFLLGCPFILLSIRLVWHISVARHVSPGDDCSLLLCGGDMGWGGGAANELSINTSVHRQTRLSRRWELWGLWNRSVRSVRD